MTDFIPEGIALTKRWELLMLKSYTDKDGSWHVGYGHGNASKVPPFVDGETLLKDDDEATHILMADLEYIVPILNKYIKIELNPFQYYACLDLAYNRGVGTFRDSAVCFHINNVDDKLHLEKACKAFVFPEEGFKPINTSFDAAIGRTREYLGLTLRRIDDASLFQTPMKGN